MERKSLIAGGVVLASALLLGVGLVSIFLAIGDDNANLPDEGSLEDILGQQAAVPFEVDESRHSGPPPVHIRVPEIAIDADVVAMGLGDDRYPEVPDSGGDVAWYTFSAPPGLGSNAVFSGHVDWLYGDLAQQGVFYRLRELAIGDEIIVELEDGSKHQYRVTGNVAVDYNDPNVVQVMNPTDLDVVTLITCGGSWVRDSGALGGNYSHRVIVRAERVQGLASGPASDG